MDAIREIAPDATCGFWKMRRRRMPRDTTTQRVGSLGHAAAFSFYPTKNLGAYGEGGALTTDDDAIAKFARAARSHGQTARYDHEFPGYNYRMDGFQGAVLRIKLRRLHGWTQSAAKSRANTAVCSMARSSRIPVDDPCDECRISPICDLCE